jgi:hypothetical protein
MSLDRKPKQINVICPPHHIIFVRLNQNKTWRSSQCKLEVATFLKYFKYSMSDFIGYSSCCEVYSTCG